MAPQRSPRRPAAAAAVALLTLLAVAPGSRAYRVHRARALLQEAAPDADALPPRVAAALAEYLSNDALNAAVHALPAACPHLNVTVRTIGASVKGVPILAFSLTSPAAPSSPLGRPNVKYVAGLHGDEPSGRQLALALAEYVCAHSAPGAPAPDARVAALLDRVSLHLAPALNPDGFAVRSRANAAGVDLNRDFPDPLDRRDNVPVGAAAAHARAAAGLAPDPDADDAADLLAPSGGEQPETAAIMKWVADTGFVASAAMHEGAVVANYPWDGTPDGATRYAACPDDATFRALARAYADASPAMVASREFAASRGTTNGAAWYPLRGGMQDWNYLAAGCFELTLELSEAKWPAAPRLPGLFRDNLDSLLTFPLVATAGARGRVSGGDGAPPPPGAAVRVRGLKGAPPARPHPVTGAFWRPLAPGNYTLAASAPGWRGAEGGVIVKGGPDGGGEVALALVADAATDATAAQPADATAAQPADATARTVRPAEAEQTTSAAHRPRRAGPPILPVAPSVNLAGERAAFVAQGAVAVASAGCLALMARTASRRAAAVAAR